MGNSELEVMNEIKGVMPSLSLWFLNNRMKVNPDKFHLLFSDKKNSSGGYLFVMRISQVSGVKIFWG